MWYIMINNYSPFLLSPPSLSPPLFPSSPPLPQSLLDLSSLPPGSYEPSIDIDQQTDSNHDTALTLAAAGGHDDLVELLLERSSDIEHRDKKGDLYYSKSDYYMTFTMHMYLQEYLLHVLTMHPLYTCIVFEDIILIIQ